MKEATSGSSILKSSDNRFGNGHDVILDQDTDGLYGPFTDFSLYEVDDHGL